MMFLPGDVPKRIPYAAAAAWTRRHADRIRRQVEAEERAREKVRAKAKDPAARPK